MKPRRRARERPTGTGEGRERRGSSSSYRPNKLLRQGASPLRPDFSARHNEKPAGRAARTRRLPRRRHSPHSSALYTLFFFFFPSFLFSRPCLQFETSGSAQKRAGGDPTLRGYSSVCRNGGRPLQSSPAVAGGLSASAFPLRLTLSPSTQAVPRATLGLCKTLPLFSSTTAALNYPVSVETGSEVGTTLQEHCKMRLTKHVLGAGP